MAPYLLSIPVYFRLYWDHLVPSWSRYKVVWSKMGTHLKLCIMYILGFVGSFKRCFMLKNLIVHITIFDCLRTVWMYPMLYTMSGMLPEIGLILLCIYRFTRWTRSSWATLNCCAELLTTEVWCLLRLIFLTMLGKCNVNKGWRIW